MGTKMLARPRRLSLFILLLRPNAGETRAVESAANFLAHAHDLAGWSWAGTKQPRTTANKLKSDLAMPVNNDRQIARRT